MKPDAAGEDLGAMPIVIGRRPMRLLGLLLILICAIAGLGLVMGREMHGLPFLAMALSGWLLASAPAIVFLVHSITRRRDGVGTAMRRSATGSGFALLTLGCMAVLLERVTRDLMLPVNTRLFSYVGYGFLALGAAVLVSAWTVPRTVPGTADRFVFRHKNQTVSGLVLALIVFILLPKFSGGRMSLAYLNVSRSDLRNLVLAQETFFRDSARYTASLSSLQFRPSSGTTSPTITVGKDWWSATNSHSRVPGVICGVAVNTTNPVIVTADSAEPVCR